MPTPLEIEGGAAAAAHSHSHSPTPEEPSSRHNAGVSFALSLSLWANVGLTLAKSYAVLASGSLVVLASLIDSLLDLASQMVVWFTARKAEKSANTKFPAGQRRLEPLGVMLCAGLMAVASMEVLRQSIVTLAGGANDNLVLTVSTVVIICIVVVVKCALWLFCRSLDVQTESLKAVTQDHLNDVFSNTVALLATIAAGMTDGKLWWMDPVGALVLSLYILASWWGTAREQIDFLVGRAASPEIIAEMRELAAKHHQDMTLDQLRMYYFGPKFLVEIEMVMNESTPLKISHDLGMALQWKIEALEEVERAFVHIDWQSREYDEHQVNVLFNKDNPNYALLPVGQGTGAEHPDEEMADFHA